MYVRLSYNSTFLWILFILHAIMHYERRKFYCEVGLQVSIISVGFGFELVRCFSDIQRPENSDLQRDIKRSSLKKMNIRWPIIIEQEARYAYN